MKRLVLTTLLIVLICLSLGFTAGQTISQGDASRGFTARFCIKMTSVGRGEIQIPMERIIARRANGDQAELEIEGGNTSFPFVYTRMKDYIFVPELRMISTMYKPARSAETPSEFDPTCETHPDLNPATNTNIGHGVFYGMPVVKWLKTLNGPEGGTREIESWEAPDCRCLSIYRRAVKKGLDGKIVAETTEMLVYLKHGEPDPELFDPPLGSMEVKPSVLHNAFQKMMGKQLFGQEGLNRIDRRYEARLKYKP